MMMLPHLELVVGVLGTSVRPVNACCCCLLGLAMLPHALHRLVDAVVVAVVVVVVVVVVAVVVAVDFFVPV